MEIVDKRAKKIKELQNLLNAKYGNHFCQFDFITVLIIYLLRLETDAFIGK